MSEYKNIRVLSTVILGFLIGYCILQLCSYFMNLISMVTFAILLTYLLVGPVNFCDKLFYQIKFKVPEAVRKYLIGKNKSCPEYLHMGDMFRKSIAIMVVYFGFCLCLIIVATQVIPPVVKQITGFAENLPTYAQVAEKSFDNFLHMVDEKVTGFDKQLQEIKPQGKTLIKKIKMLDAKNQGQKAELIITDDTSEDFQSEQKPRVYRLKASDLRNNATLQVARWIKDNVGKMLQNIFGFVSGTLTGFVYTLTCFVLAFYFLMDGKAIIYFFNALFPKKYLAIVQKIEHEAHLALLGFIRGQLILGVMAGVFMYPVYVYFGVEYAILLAFILTIAEIVPVIGSTLGFIPTILVLLLHGQFVELLFVWIIFWFMQTVKDHLIAPKIVGDMIGLHPVTVILSLWIGVQVAGFVGVLFAIPVACVLNVIVTTLVLGDVHEAKPKDT